MPTDKQKPVSVLQALAWAIAEVEGRTRYNDDGQFFNALDAAKLTLTAAEQAQECSSPNCECMFPRDCPAEPEYEQAQGAQPVVSMYGEYTPITIGCSTSPTIPEGWQLVPIEPTREMLEAWIDDSSFPSSYRAMLAAAPKPEGNK